MLNLFFGLFSFVLGSIVGSFLNCVIYRLETGESFLKGRSYCPHCKHILDWRDLIPIFSFFILGGKCRYCSQKISWQYPLVEIATGLLFLSIFNFQFSRPEGARLAQLYWAAIFNLIIACFLIIIFVYDLKHYIIPDKVIYPAIALTFLYQLISNFLPHQIFGGGSIFKYLILSALGSAAFFLTIVLISRGKWMGVGDIKLALLMGLFLSFPNILVALFLAFFIGALTGLILIAFSKKTLKSEIPFGPFLVTGTFLAMFFGQKLIDTYLNLFLLK